jgi:hypothetical protein
MLRWLSRIGLSRGLLGGSRAWTTIGGMALAARLVKRLVGGEPKVVYQKKLKPGETVLISHDRRPRVLQPPL